MNRIIEMMTSALTKSSLFEAMSLAVADLHYQAKNTVGKSFIPVFSLFVKPELYGEAIRVVVESNLGDLMPVEVFNNGVHSWILTAAIDGDIYLSSNVGNAGV